MLKWQKKYDGFYLVFFAVYSLRFDIANTLTTAKKHKKALKNKTFSYIIENEEVSLRQRKEIIQ
jgi:hypothetical protein